MLRSVSTERHAEGGAHIGGFALSSEVVFVSLHRFESGGATMGVNPSATGVARRIEEVDERPIDRGGRKKRRRKDVGGRRGRDLFDRLGRVLLHLPNELMRELGLVVLVVGVDVAAPSAWCAI